MSGLLSKLSLNQITLNKLNLKECVEACVRHDVGWIAPWRNKVAEIGLGESARIIRDSGLRVSGLCRGGYFPAATATERAVQIDDNFRAIDEAAALPTTASRAARTVYLVFLAKSVYLASVPSLALPSLPSRPGPGGPKLKTAIPWESGEAGEESCGCREGQG